MALVYVVVYLVVALLRLTYPFELEWLEGAAWQQVMRLNLGQPVYVQPSLSFVPLIYPPLYFTVSAAFTAILGAGFLPLRLVSLLASLGCGAVIFALVRHETQRTWSGLVAAGLFMATYRLSEGWFDTARVDTLFVFVVLLTIYLARRASLRSGVVAGVCGALAFLTKQPAVVIAVPIGLYCLIADPKRGAVMISTALGVVVSAVLILNALSGGWYVYYTFELPRQHTLVRLDGSVFNNLLADLIVPVGLAIGLAASWVIAQVRSASSRSRGWFYALALIGLLTASLIGRMNPGGFRNVMLPAYAGVGLIAGLGVAYWSDRKWISAVTALIVLICQFVVLAYDPRPLVPTERDRQAGQQLVQALREIDGEVYIPYHPYLAMMAGKPAYAHQTTLDELQGGFGGAPTTEWADIRREIHNALNDKRFAQIILDVSDWPSGDIAPYQKRGAVFGNAGVFWLVTGWRTRPDFVYCRTTADSSCRAPLVAQHREP